MLDENNTFEMKKTISANDGKSFFRMAEMDLSDPIPDKPRPPAAEAKEPLRGGHSALPKAQNLIKPGEKTEQKAVQPAKAPVKPAPAHRERQGDGAYLAYENFRIKREELTAAFSQTADIMQRLNMMQLKNKLADLGERIQRDAFKIQIVGNFKNGKSTFINSFLGEEVLPAYALPCTAVINEVKYGAEKRAIIHFKNPLPKTLPAELSREAVGHIKAHLPGKIPPMEVPYDKIEEYVVIPVGKDPKDMLLESPYERVELFWPLPLLKNGIEIIDSPGLNEHTTRTKVTMDFLTKSDAIIFVLNATMLCSKDEMTFIEKSLHSNGFKDLFFVVNRFDMIPDGEKKRIMEYGKKNLLPLTNLGEKGIFFVSAKNALTAKAKGDEKGLRDSGMSDFERILSLFLTKKKGALKLMSPARSITNFLQEEALKKIIPQHYERLSATSKEVGKEHDILLEKIEALERKKELLANVLEMEIKQLGSVLAPLARENIKVASDALFQWLMAFNSMPIVGFSPTRDQVIPAINELMEYIRMNLEGLNAAWCEKEIVPLLNERKAAAFSSVKRQMELLVKAPETSAEDPYKRFNTRFSAPSPDAEGDVTLRTVTQITSAPLFALMAAFSTAEIRELICARFMKKMNWNSSGAIRLKTITSEEVAMGMRNGTADFADGFVREVALYFRSAAEKTLAPLDNEISSLKNKLEFVSATNGMNKADVEARKAELNRTGDEIKALCKKLQNIVASFEVRK